MTESIESGIGWCKGWSAVDIFDWLVDKEIPRHEALEFANAHGRGYLDPNQHNIFDKTVLIKRGVILINGAVNNEESDIK